MLLYPEHAQIFLDNVNDVKYSDLKIPKLKRIILVIVICQTSSIMSFTLLTSHNFKRICKRDLHNKGLHNEKFLKLSFIFSIGFVQL